MKFLKFLILASVICLSASATERVFIYEVQENETISSILYKLDLEPIYGEDGYQHRTRVTNRKVRLGERLHPGDKVEILLREVDQDLLNSKSESEIKEVESVLPLPVQTFNQEPAPALVEKTPHSVSVPVAEVASLPARETQEIIPNLEEEKVPDTNFEYVEIKETESESITVAEVEVEKSKIDDDQEDDRTVLKLSPSVSWMKVTSERNSRNQNVEISAQSKPMIGMGASYGLQWTERLLVSLFAKISQLSFYEDENYSFKRNDFTKKDLGVLADFKISETQSYQLAAGFFEEVFLSLASAKVIHAEVVPVPEFHASYRYKMINRPKRKLSLGLHSRLIAPYQGSKVTNDLGYGAGGDLAASLKQTGIKFFYNYVHLNSKNKGTYYHEVGLGFIWEKDFHD